MYKINNSKEKKPIILKIKPTFARVLLLASNVPGANFSLVSAAFEKKKPGIDNSGRRIRPHKPRIKPVNA